MEPPTLASQPTELLLQGPRTSAAFRQGVFLKGFVNMEDVEAADYCDLVYESDDDDPRPLGVARPCKLLEAAAGDADVVRMLLRGGVAGLAAKGRALVKALRLGNTAAAQVLVAAGAPLDRRLRGGLPLLHHFALHGNEKALQLLLPLAVAGDDDPRPILRRRGSRRNRRDRRTLWINERDAGGRTVLDIAHSTMVLFGGLHHEVHELLRRGAATSRPGHRLFVALNLRSLELVKAESRKADVNGIANAIGHRPIHVSVQLDSLMMSRALIDAGADVDAAPEGTWMHWNSWERRQPDYPVTIAALPADEQQAIRSFDRRGVAVAIAVENCNGDLLELLLSSGAAPSTYSAAAKTYILGRAVSALGGFAFDRSVPLLQRVLDAGCLPDPAEPVLFQAASDLKRAWLSANQPAVAVSVLTKLRDAGASVAPPEPDAAAYLTMVARYARRLPEAAIEALVQLGVEKDLLLHNLAQ
ncbi:hypothetical protein HK105_200340 [Polyrhizophydium stewartii]|uniref:Ankyrin repeat protein n=1 Tax=Polyrhizophydium stewartii TaxID=2732419 RepID=A0ABR4NLF5_9FUNG